MTMLEKSLVFYLLLLGLRYSSNESVMMSVCPSEQLNLTCNTMSDQTILRWNLTFPNRPGYELRDILTFGSATPLTVNQTMFQFFRTSVSPLISTVVIDNVNAVLSGTRVECFYGGRVMTIIIINVIGNDIAAPGPITISEPEQFRNDTVAVFLKWTVKESYDTINLIVSPQVVVNVSNRTSAQLTLSYDTLYSVNVTANVCGRSLSSSSTTELFYVKCDDPLNLLTEASKRLVSTNYQSPAIEGTNVTFNCSDSQLLLEGPESATCIESGRWEPDPSNVECIQNDVVTPRSYGNGTFADNTHCNNTKSPGIVDQSPIIAAVVSSIVVTAVVFFTLGCASGWFGHKYKDNIQSKSGKNTNTQPAPLYEDLQPTSTSQEQEKAFELKENVAYGPLRET